MQISELKRRLLRRSRYGTPIAPGLMGEPWWWIPRSNRDALRLLTSPGILKRLGAIVGAVVIFSLLWGFLHQPPPTPPIGPVNQASSNFGPIVFRAPIGWLIVASDDTMTTQPLVLFAPQADPNRAPVTISFLSVNVTPNYQQIIAAASIEPPSSSAPGDSASLAPDSIRNPRTLLSAVIASYLPRAGRGPYCTTDLTYGVATSQTGVLPVATQITWLETRPLGYQVQPGNTENLGPCTAASSPKIVHGPFPTYSLIPTLAPASLPPAPIPTTGASPAISPVTSASAGTSSSPKASGSNHPTPLTSAGGSLPPAPSAVPATAAPTVATTAPPVSAPASVAPASSPTLGASAAAGASASAATEGAPMVAIQWFALPDRGVFKSSASQSMLVITLMYPADLSSDDIANLIKVYNTVVSSIAPS